MALLAGLLAVRGMGVFSQTAASDDRQFDRRVNLAMRQAADRLLDLAGDTTHPIPPVEKLIAGEYLLRLENDFDYDSLPAYLEAALAQLGIHEAYNVSVNDCWNNQLILGYDAQSLKDGQAPCGGREQKTGCYNLMVSFPLRHQVKNPDNSTFFWSALAGLAFALIGVFYFKNRKNQPTPLLSATPQTTGNSTMLRFGNSALDPSNLYAVVGGNRQQLTFREAKLLHFFAQHPNQVLEREAILAAVWEDEGIIVGRSLDVFVSRLRKILQKDPSVRLVNVHGVGYRLEVEAS